MPRHPLGSPRPIYLPGYYIAGHFGPASWQTVNNSNGPNRVTTTPMNLSRKVTIDQLGCRVETAVVGAKVHMGVYDSDPDTGLPRTLKVSATADASVAGYRYVALAAAATLDAGDYWLAAVPTDGTSALYCSANNTHGGVLPFQHNDWVLRADMAFNGLSTTDATFGAGLPATFPATLNVTTNAWRVALHLV